MKKLLKILGIVLGIAVLAVLVVVIYISVRGTGSYAVNVSDGICPVSANVVVIIDPNAVVPQADFSSVVVCLNSASPSNYTI